MRENRPTNAVSDVISGHFAGLDWVSEHVGPQLGELAAGELVLVLADLARAAVVAIIMPADPQSGEPRAVRIDGLAVAVALEVAGHLCGPGTPELASMAFGESDGRRWFLTPASIGPDTTNESLMRAWERLQAASL